MVNVGWATRKKPGEYLVSLTVQKTTGKITHKHVQKFQ